MLGARTKWIPPVLSICSIMPGTWHPPRLPSWRYLVHQNRVILAIADDADELNDVMVVDGYLHPLCLPKNGRMPYQNWVSCSSFATFSFCLFGRVNCPVCRLLELTLLQNHRTNSRSFRRVLHILCVDVPLIGNHPSSSSASVSLMA